MPLAAPLSHGPTPSAPAGAIGPFLWRFDPGLTAVLVVTALGYAAALFAARRRGRPVAAGWHAAAFYAGLVAMATALLGPLDAFNDTSFAIHMAQHLVLMQLAAPLLVLGRPFHLLVQGVPPRRLAGLLRATIGRRWLRRGLGALCHPVVVVALWNVTLLAWHTPRWYEAALADPIVHDLEHIMFLLTSLLFWWVVIDPLPAHHRASPHAVVGMAFANCMGGGLVAMALLFSPRVLYPSYVAAAAQRPFGAAGADALADQRLGGWIMLLTGGLYLAAIYRVVWRSRRAGEAEPHLAGPVDGTATG